jgi:SAM-dependent methyltransferase
MNQIYDSIMLDLYKKYPWLKVTTTVEDYVAPKYYDRLLKDYTFLGKTDLQLFEEYLKNISNKKIINALELGCGSGRVTNVFLNHFKNVRNSLKMVDLSSRMLEFCHKKFKNFNNLDFVKSDSVEFLNKNRDIYDTIFSLWSFSHSTHQILIRDGIDEGKKYIQGVIKKMVDKNMIKGSSFFLIHFDSMSDEQKILMRQWKKVYSIYKNTNVQSPSKLLIDETFQLLEKQGIIKLELKYYVGEEIIYSSIEEALEIFLNFHMESYFNDNPTLLPQVMDELVDYFKDFTDTNGLIKIKPGCFLYTVTKI